MSELELTEEERKLVFEKRRLDRELNEDKLDKELKRKQFEFDNRSTIDIILSYKSEIKKLITDREIIDVKLNQMRDERKKLMNTLSKTCTHHPPNSDSYFD